jgi:phospholipase D-like protein
LTLRLVETGWGEEFANALRADQSTVRVVSPFVKRRAAGRLLAQGEPQSLQVITRFNLENFSEGVSDTSALRFLLDHGAEIRGIRSLHAKLYLLGTGRVIVTSANLTEAALSTNYEFGFVADDQAIVDVCTQYFDNLWTQAGPNLTAQRLAEWEARIENHLARRPRRPPASSLGDEGVDLGPSSKPPELPPWVDEATQSFIKFFGKTDSRAPRSTPILDEVRRSGSHWACTYPRGKRPRIVQDGATMFIGRMVEDPDDILVYGRAVGMRHEPGRDDATAEDVRLRPGKVDFPYYVRVHHPEFMAGTLGNGVSMTDLMDSLDFNAFATTQENARAGSGNTNPRHAYSQQAAVRLSPQGRVWMNEKLEMAFAARGQLSEAVLDELDWPADFDALRGTPPP